MYGNVYNNLHLSVVLVRRGKNSVVLFCLLSSFFFEFVESFFVDVFVLPYRPGVSGSKDK